VHGPVFQAIPDFASERDPRTAHDAHAASTNDDLDVLGRNANRLQLWGCDWRDQHAKESQQRIGVCADRTRSCLAA
jgi:hypothetical protein